MHIVHLSFTLMIAVYQTPVFEVEVGGRNNFPVFTTESYKVGGCNGADKTPTPPSLSQSCQTLQESTVSLLALTKQ